MFKIANPNSTVFLELNANGVARNIALPPNDDRGVLVGSTPLAHVRLTGERIAPVQFHLERCDEEVVLVPAYGIRDLVLNGASVAGPVPLERRNVIEFGGVLLRALVLEGERTDDYGDQITKLREGRSFGASYLVDLPGEHDVTRQAMRPMDDRPADEWPTVAIPRSSLQSESATQEAAWHPEETTRRLVPTRPTATNEDDVAFTSNGTQIMAPYRPPLVDRDGDGTNAAASNQLVHISELPARPPWPTPLQSESSVAGDPSRVPLPSIVHTRRMPASASTVAPERASRFEESRAQPPARYARKPQRSVSWLARLGMLTTAHPLLVGTGATLVALLIALVPVALTRLIERHEQPLAAQTTRSVSVALNPLRPAPMGPASPRARLTTQVAVSAESSQSVLPLAQSVAEPPRR